ncbi:hypothetical protein HK096_002328 [Nowakowskiella sp. JEL0078]|nr:hypothetical protein HK096_002328 [Nowakowskiella sp. JEL0078]
MQVDDSVENILKRVNKIDENDLPQFKFPILKSSEISTEVKSFQTILKKIGEIDESNLPKFNFRDVKPSEDTVMVDSDIQIVEKKPIIKVETTKEESVADILKRVNQMNKNDLPKFNFSVVKSHNLSVEEKSILDILKQVDHMDKSDLPQFNLHVLNTSSSEISSSTPAVIKQPQSELKSIWGNLKTAGWTCTECFIVNKESVNQCISCNAPATQKSSNITPQSTLSNQLVMPALNSFDSVLSNKETSNTGISSLTDSLKPSVTSISVPEASVWGAVNTAGWNCKMCLIRNKDSDVKCASCETPNPQKSDEKPPLSTVFGGFSAMGTPSFGVSTNTGVNPSFKFKPSVKLTFGSSNSDLSSGFGSTSTNTETSTAAVSIWGKPSGWKCKECLIVNKESDTKCASCETPNSLITSNDKSPQQKSTTFGSNLEGVGSDNVGFKPSSNLTFGSYSTTLGSFSSVANKETSSIVTSVWGNTVGWKCKECLIVNKESDVKCASCETPNFGKSGDKLPQQSLGTTAGNEKSTSKVFGSGSESMDFKTSVKSNPGSNEPSLLGSTGVGSTKTSLSGFGSTFGSTGTELNKTVPTPAAIVWGTKPAGWTCKVCLISNKESDTKCVSCEVPNPIKATDKTSTIEASFETSETTGGFTSSSKSAFGFTPSSKSAFGFTPSSKATFGFTPSSSSKSSFGFSVPSTIGSAGVGLISTPGFGFKVPGSDTKVDETKSVAATMAFGAPSAPWPSVQPSTVSTTISEPSKIEEAKDDAQSSVTVPFKFNAITTTSSELIKLNTNALAFVPTTESKQVSSLTGGEFKSNTNASVWETAKSVGWECESCLVKNKESDSQCLSCQTPNSKNSKENKKLQPPSVSFGFGESPAKSVFGSITPSVPRFGFAVNTSIDSSKLNENLPTNSQDKNEKSTGVVNTSSIWGNTKKDGWKCDVCMIVNNETDSNCLSCQAPNHKKSAEEKPLQPSFGSSTSGKSFVGSFGSSKTAGFGSVDETKGFTPSGASMFGKIGTPTFGFGSEGTANQVAFGFGVSTTNKFGSGGESTTDNTTSKPLPIEAKSLQNKPFGVSGFGSTPVNPFILNTNAPEFKPTTEAKDKQDQGKASGFKWNLNAPEFVTDGDVQQKRAVPKFGSGLTFGSAATPGRPTGVGFGGGVGFGVFSEGGSLFKDVIKKEDQKKEEDQKEEQEINEEKKI